MDIRSKIPHAFSVANTTFCFTYFVVLVAFVAISLSANAYANMTVSDKNFQACLDKLANANKWTSAEDVSDIKCNSMNIRSIQGVAQFPNLKALSIFNNQLTRVDADLSRLKHLEMLNVARNKIKSLTLENIPALQNIYAFGNKIGSIKLSNLPALAMIKAQNNQADTFEYEALPNLSKIYIFNNQLEHIDIYSLPALTYLDCRQNPMPDPLYDEMDEMEAVLFLHDGNADDW